LHQVKGQIMKKMVLKKHSPSRKNSMKPLIAVFG